MQPVALRATRAPKSQSHTTIFIGKIFGPNNLRHRTMAVVGGSPTLRFTLAPCERVATGEMSPVAFRKT